MTDDIRRQIAAAIAEQLNGQDLADLGRFHSGAFGVMVGGRIVPENRFHLPSEEDAVEWHAVIRLGMPDGGEG